MRRALDLFGCGGGGNGGVPARRFSRHRNKLGRNLTTAEQREAMGIDWLPRRFLSQALPPAYTEFIGTAFLAQQPR